MPALPACPPALQFGLRAREIVAVVNSLAEEGMLDCLNLLHFHVGSQITNIRMVKEVGAGGSGSWWVLWGIVKEVGAGGMGCSEWVGWVGGWLSLGRGGCI